MLHIHPEWNPRNNHEKDGWNVGLDKVETDTSSKLELRSQAAVVAWKFLKVILVNFYKLYFK